MFYVWRKKIFSETFCGIEICTYFCTRIRASEPRISLNYFSTSFLRRVLLIPKTVICLSNEVWLLFGLSQCRFLFDFGHVARYTHNLRQKPAAR